jgi:hypothetical protein
MAFLKSAIEVYRVIIHGHRHDEKSEWILTAKLVAKNEQDSLEHAIKPLSAEIKSELRAIHYEGQLEYLSFFRRKGSTELGIKLDGAPYKRIPPSAKLLQILSLVDEIYEQAGLCLLSCDWTLNNGFEYSEYYE